MTYNLNSFQPLRLLVLSNQLISLLLHELLSLDQILQIPIVQLIQSNRYVVNHNRNNPYEIYVITITYTKLSFSYFLYKVLCRMYSILTIEIQYIYISGIIT